MGSRRGRTVAERTPAALVVTISSDYAREYSIGLRQCETLERLREFMLHWASLAVDAYLVVDKMKAEDFAEFRRGLELESRKEFAGKEWALKYGAVVMPTVMLMVTALAGQFGVPWGAAFQQCERYGLVKRQGDVYVWAGPPAEQPS